MEFGPILRSLLFNRTRFALIILQVAFSLAIMVNCVNLLLDTRKNMIRPTGLDEENLITVSCLPFENEFRETGYLRNVQKEDIETLRSLTGVAGVVPVATLPLSSSGTWSEYQPVGSKLEAVPGNTFWCGPGVVAGLGGRLLAGRDLVEEDINDNDTNDLQAVISKPLADRLFPNGDALGKQLRYRVDIPRVFTIVGMVDAIHGTFPHWQYVDQVLFVASRPGGFDYGFNYVVRSEPGQSSTAMAGIEERLLAIDAGRTVTVAPLSEMKTRAYSGDAAQMRLLGWLIFLVTFVTGLGIVGITSFSVAERRRQVGTRRALGARRVDILRYFLTENWLMTTIGLTIGVAFAYVLNYLIATEMGGTRLDWRLLVPGVLLLWVVGLLSAAFPALRASRVPPVVATRTI